MNLEEKNTIFKPVFTLNHSPIKAYFSKNSKDFVVREVPLYEFSGEGEHLVFEIAKKDLSTHEALRLLSEHLGAKMRDFGYAGLKDKQGYTTQFLSLPRSFESRLLEFKHEKLEIKNTFLHKNKLKIGHLKGNSFFIRLKKVGKVEAIKLENAFKALKEQGFANYFGYQRFGKFKDNFNLGLEILHGKKLKNKKMSDFFISAFQSELFNRYLSKRVELSHFASKLSLKEFALIYKLDEARARKIVEQKQFFKLLENEVLGHYPFGKCFLCEDLDTEIKRFLNKELSPMGLLLGVKAFECKEGLAQNLEDEIYHDFYTFKSKMQGSRRFAWSFLEAACCRYDEQKAHFCLEFFLQKGSYATTILEELLHARFDEFSNNA
ncbi:tRNA pseudouridine(13) synthase TruD [Campylobacter sp. MIT 12-8780]|uniref:tRNA pseudouridine(13) synthase TruD n=1 Tax=Campylobacter sp. MIT 12-8780 TaxID=2202200 RepID=UPI00115C63D6|nr:tRNA pseudouridine(13) synthase TruD [Campylobacter sp. MIT 12-8780]TQR40785.1 tRNA pseudouridine(13) synthase TruD [Campylobacter sp. MIT 12-8780]